MEMAISEAWVAAIFGMLGLGVTVTLAVWRFGRDMGEIKSGIRELLDRDERMNLRMATAETRLNDHMERLARIEGSSKLPSR